MSEHNHSEDNPHAHDPSYGVYILIWIALIALTAITVTIAGMNFGATFTVVSALTIASIKTLLVANYFMHVKFDTRVFKVFVLLCIIILAVVIFLTFFDLTFREPLI